MTQITPLIQEVYKDYTPSVNVKKIVKILLQYVPPEDLAHLQTIVLMNTAALSRERKRQRSSSGASILEVMGRYHPGYKEQPAYIEIYVDNILEGRSDFYLKLPFSRNFLFAEVLFHEIGHHVQYWSKSKLTDKEVFADKHAVELSRMFFRQHYWFLRPFKVPIMVLSWFMKKLRLVELVEKHGRVEKR